MSTLDRYIIRTFLINAAVLTAVLVGLFVVVDLLVDIDEFIKAGKAFAPDYGGFFPALLAKMAEWYGPLLLLLYVNGSGLVAVAAMAFTLVQMHRNRELVALLAGGVSMYRIAAPIVLIGFALNVLTFPAQELVIPAYADQLARSKSHLKYRTGRHYPVRYAADERGHMLSAARFITLEKKLERVTILLREPATGHDPGGAAVGRITADEARWVEDYQPAPSPLYFDDPFEGEAGWYFPGGGYAVETGAAERRGRPAQAEPTPVRFFPTSLSPRVLQARRASMLPKLLSIRELREMRDNPAVDPPQRARITQSIWSRFSLQVVNVLILVMGLPFFLLRTPKNLMGQSVKAAGVCVGAWGNGLVMLSVAGAIPPVAAAWLPVVLYLPIATALLLRVET